MEYIFAAQMSKLAAGTSMKLFSHNRRNVFMVDEDGNECQLDYVNFAKKRMMLMMMMMTKYRIKKLVGTQLQD